MKVAVISDIHGNRQAFEATLEAVAASDAAEVWCLGDLVGYGADPDACVELAREHAAVCLAGNHDLAVTGDIPMDDFSRGASLAAQWTQEVIAPQNLDFLRTLSPQGQETHNAYLSATAELGFPGLAIFLGLLIATALALRRVARRAARIGEDFLARAANALLVGLAGWAIASVFLSSEASRPFWMVIGLSLALTAILERAEARLPVPDAPLTPEPVPAPT